MSLLIKGMEMPTDCAMMLKIFPDGKVGVPVHLNWAGTMVVKDAEAVPITPHGRLIDADAFETAMFNDSYQDFVHILAQLPTVIPAEEEE